MAKRVVTVNDLLDGHVLLDIECLDRIYLNAYVPILQSSGQVVGLGPTHAGSRHAHRPWRETAGSNRRQNERGCRARG